MIPITELGANAGAGIHTLITDIDDTITSEGLLKAKAYGALEALRQAGLRVIVTTGRPAGWCDHIARMWPVDAVVGENGAVCYWYDRERRILASSHSLSELDLRLNRERVAAVAAEVLREVPGTALASDQFCRLYDLAIDYCEDVPRVSSEGVERIVRVMEASGMTAKVSSIHVNGWFGRHDKLSMTRSLVLERWGLDIDRDREGFAYAGDSPNDSPMFGHFPYSFGVANVRDFLGRMESLPRYITNSRSGDGFAELVDRLITLREMT